MNNDSLKSIIVSLATIFAAFWRAKVNDGKIDALESFSAGSQAAGMVPALIAQAKDIPAEWADGGYDQEEVNNIVQAVEASLPSDLSPYALNITVESLRLLGQGARTFQVIQDAIEASKPLQTDSN